LDVVRNHSDKTGFTLTELLVVMTIMLMLAVVAIPAAREILKSFESASNMRTVIDAALCNARAIAAREQCYAGVRFQHDLKGRQYMIFIVHDPAAAPRQINLNRDPYVTGTGLTNGFRALEGRKPISLPENTGVMDLKVKTDYTVPTPIITERDVEVVGNDAASDMNIDETAELMDTTTFSIVFSPAGKLVVHDVRVRNRTGRIDSDSDVGNFLYNPDDVFNTKGNVENGDAMFYQDDYVRFGLVEESSRNCFVLYDKREFDKVPVDKRWSEYLRGLDVIYINPHTGEIVNK
jgi:prepilin-type N-terminal cleavage/methylation domain-containing protein